MKLYLTRLFCCLLAMVMCHIAFGQGSKVKIDGESTENERKAWELFEQRDAIRDEIDKGMNAFENDYGSVLRKKTSMQTGSMSKEELPAFIQEMQRAIQAREHLNFVRKYNNMQSLYDRENALLGNPKSNYHKDKAEIERSYINELKGYLTQAQNQLHGKEQETKEEQAEKQKQQAYQEEIDFLDEEIAKQQEQIAKQEAQIKAKEKDISLDDFLAENNIIENNDMDDFLAEDEPNNDTDDFLAENDNSENSDDFLADSDKELKEKNWKIEYRDGLRGVVDLNGNTLIPFKEWIIVEYKNGIAKVRLVTDKFNINECKGSGTVYKTGFVDNSGKWLDETFVEVEGGFTAYLLFTMETIWTKENMSIQQKAYKECQRKFNAWKLRMLSQN